jgi:hypothetical protein
MFYDRQGEPLSYPEWTVLFYDKSYAHVRATAVGEDVLVSTVWIGIDMSYGNQASPVIFETMVFGGELEDAVWRYSTEEQACAGHDKAVAAARFAIEEIRPL